MLYCPATLVASRNLLQEAIFDKIDFRIAVAGKDLFSYFIRFRIFYTSHLMICIIVFKYILTFRQYFQNLVLHVSGQD